VITLIDKSALSRITYVFPAITKLYIAKLDRLAKRGLDIFVSLVGLIILGPFFLVIAFAIKRDSSGPVFFHGLRTGRDGQPFFIHKFRTMHESLESYQGLKITAQNDRRITPLGHWLRDTKLNEIPQLWNVLVGDMSLVGPRPADPEIIASWHEDSRREILSLRPGITSPASVIFRNEEKLLNAKLDVMDTYFKSIMPNKNRLDQLYVQNRSIWLDLDILFWTFLIVLPLIKAYTPPEALLFVGPMTRFIRRYLNWFTIDIIVTFVAISLVHIVWNLIGNFVVMWQTGFAYAIVFSFTFSIIGAFLGVNRIRWSKPTLGDVTSLFPAWMIASALAIAINNISQIYPPVVVYFASTISLIGFILVRFNNRFTIFILSQLARYLRATVTSERVLILGSGRTAESISWMLNHPTYSDKFRVIGYVENDVLTQGMSIYGANVLGNYTDIPKLVKTHNIGVIIVADNRISLKEYESITKICNTSSIRLLVIPDVFGSLKNLLVTPPFSVSTQLDGTLPAHALTMANGDASPCHFCVGRYTRLEVEAQIETLSIADDVEQ
jgi:lipopolysaccharide/colanic/teichoic acid biosynthesis glycosyltransferase